MTETISTYLWPGQTHFGFGAVEKAAQEVLALQARQVFILTDPGIISAQLLDPVVSSLETSKLGYFVYENIPANPDIDSVDAATSAFRESGADVILGIGGGSVLDAAKGVRLASGAPPGTSIGEFSPLLGDRVRPSPPVAEMPPMIAVPTTAGTGAEVTPWGVLTDLESKCKFGIGGAFLVPNIALVDPGMTLTLPPGLTAATGLDALSHCIEAYVSTKNNPVLDPMILYGIELIGRSLRLAVAQPSNRTTRHDMMLASLIAGIAISSKWLGACHSLAHQLSPFANVHHGIAIALMLPHQMAFSLPAALDRYSDVGAALSGLDRRAMTADGLDSKDLAERSVIAVRDLIRDVGLPTQLRDVGVTEEMIPQMARNAYELDGNWPTNPRIVCEADFDSLYREAW